jgi:DNA-binding transcriptional LysR family regulator
LSVTPFYSDPLVVIAPREPRWRGRRSVTPHMLAGEPLILFERGGAIRAVMDGWFAKAKAAANVAMELGNAEASKKLVGAGLGLSIISAVAVKKELAAGELVALATDPPLARQLAIVRRRDKPSTPGFAAVLTALESFARRTARRGAQSGSPRNLLRSSSSV